MNRDIQENQEEKPWGLEDLGFVAQRGQEGDLSSRSQRRDGARADDSGAGTKRGAEKLQTSDGRRFSQELGLRAEVLWGQIAVGSG